MYISYKFIILLNFLVIKYVHLVTLFLQNWKYNKYTYEEFIARIDLCS